MNTIEKITTVTKDMVAQAFAGQSKRIQAAAHDMSERYYRRHADGVNPTEDMPDIACPDAPDMPEALAKCISPNTYGIRYVTREQWASAISMHGLTRTYQGRDYFDLLPGSPTDYLAGLKAISALADEYERLSREYKATVTEALAGHVRQQMDAAKDLAAIVLATKMPVS